VLPKIGSKRRLVRHRVAGGHCFFFGASALLVALRYYCSLSRSQGKAIGKLSPRVAERTLPPEQLASHERRRLRMTQTFAVVSTISSSVIAITRCSTARRLRHLVKCHPLLEVKRLQSSDEFAACSTWSSIVRRHAETQIDGCTGVRFSIAVELISDECPLSFQLQLAWRTFDLLFCPHTTPRRSADA
jgi:hypothetical protein